MVCHVRPAPIKGGFVAEFRSSWFLHKTSLVVAGYCRLESLVLFSVMSCLSVCFLKCLHYLIVLSICAIFTMCKCSFPFIYRFQDDLNKSHVKKITSSLVIRFTWCVDNVLRSPTGFWTTTCRSELNFQIFQSPKNFGSKPCEL